MSRARVLLAAAGVLAAVLLSSGRSAGSATLVSAAPADGSRLPVAPAVVQLVFDGPVRHSGSHLSVTGPGNRPVGSGPVTVTGETLRLPVADVGSGAYTVAYQVALTDGRQASGLLGYGVRATPSRASAAHQHAEFGPTDRLLIAVDVMLVIVVLGVLLRSPRIRAGGGWRLPPGD
jgi:methionine-rich copper-binding protein CopC